jgi:hypothetical protein
MPEMDMVGVVSALTREKQVGLEWTYKQGGQTLRHSERLDLSFWPTAIAAMDGNELLVAGKKPSNTKTVLLHVTLQLPDWPGPNFPNTQTQETTVLVDTSARIKVIKPFPGLEHSAILVRSDGSVATVNYATSQVTELYGPGVYPKLALDHMSMGLSAEHEQWGYVFLVKGDPNVHLDGGVVMKDLNKDGIIDEVLELDSEDWIGDAQWLRFF